MKRHASLHPLSRDHHHALVQARELRRAAARANEASWAAAAANFISFWERELERHFQQEEEVLLPATVEYLAVDDDQISTTLAQHAAIRRLVGTLNNTPRAEYDARLLDQLGAALNEHIRFEENELFPLIEQCVPEEVLWRIAEQLTPRGMCALTASGDGTGTKP